MPGHSCFHVGCRSGYKGTTNNHFFRLPDNSKRKQLWLQNIPKRVDKQFDDTSRLCHLHFEEKYLIKEHTVKYYDQIIARQPRKLWDLTEDAVPTIFKNDKVPSYFDKKAPVLRKAPTVRHEIPVKRPRPKSLVEVDRAPTPDGEHPPDGIDLVGQLKQEAANLNLPSNDWGLKVGGLTEDDPAFMIFYELTGGARYNGGTLLADVPLSIRKSIRVCQDLSVVVHVIDKLVPSKNISSVQDLQSLINHVNLIPLCEGVKGFGCIQVKCKSCTKDTNGVWYSNKCLRMCNTKMCTECTKTLCLIQFYYSKAQRLVIKNVTRANKKANYHHSH